MIVPMSRKKILFKKIDHLITTEGTNTKTIDFKLVYRARKITESSTFLI
jgi:hypothetical protein